MVVAYSARRTRHRNLANSFGFSVQVACGELVSFSRIPLFLSQDITYVDEFKEVVAVGDDTKCLPCTRCVYTGASLRNCLPYLLHKIF